MDILVLKLVATPLLIGMASLAGRRWGETISGWFIGLPLTSGPVCFFLAVEQGTGFAAAAACGCLAGAAAEAGFCLAYGIAAEAGFCLAYGIAARRGGGWPSAIGAGTIAFAVAAAAMQLAAPLLWLLAAIVYLALILALRLMPRLAAGRAQLPSPPRWDLPARMIVATVLVFLLTELAPVFGPRLSGLLATYPLFGPVLAAFAHRLSGAAAAGRVLRGLSIGLFGFSGFFVLLALALELVGIAAAFAAATALALAIQGGSLWAMRRLPPEVTPLRR